MIDLKDPVLQLLIALVAIVIPFVIYLLQRQKKALSYSLVSTTHLLTDHEEFEGKLQVLYEGQPTQNISLLILKFINSGNVPIASNDYERQVSILLGENSKILSAVVIEMEPKNLDAEAIIDDNRIKIKEILLNPKDAITLKILVSNFDNFSIDGRIIGVKEIDDFGRASKFQKVLFFLFSIIFLIGMYLVMKHSPAFQVQTLSAFSSWEAKIGLIMVTISYIGIILAMRKKEIKEILVKALNRIF
jgi:hypothetical protein